MSRIHVHTATKTSGKAIVQHAVLNSLEYHFLQSFLLRRGQATSRHSVHYDSIDHQRQLLFHSVLQSFASILVENLQTTDGDETWIAETQSLRFEGQVVVSTTH